MRIFLAGATGAVGRSLIPLLRNAGYAVTGMTRTTEGMTALDALGAHPVIADVYDIDALEGAITAAAPDVLIHQLTDLSGGVDAEGARRNARLRREGTTNLMRAARSAGVRRVIAQSIAWAYAPKATPCSESDPLDIEATGQRAVTVLEAVAPLESAVLDQGDFEGIVLRYGQFYGPGTWSSGPSGSSPVHVEAAAFAAALAVDRGKPGIYNIAEPGGAVTIDKALDELGWCPDFRISQKM